MDWLRWLLKLTAVLFLVVLLLDFVGLGVYAIVMYSQGEMISANLHQMLNTPTGNTAVLVMSILTMVGGTVYLAEELMESAHKLNE